MNEELKKRTKEFALNCIKVIEILPNTYLGNHIKGELISCSTSVATNFRATCVANNKVSYLNKISSVIDNVDESKFWLELALDENLIQKNIADILLDESNELTSIFITARKTAGKKL